MEPTICVNILSYIEDHYPSMPEKDRPWIADKIAKEFYYADIYDALDSWVKHICWENKISCEPEIDSEE